jgi:drug/metabolite transporter (DMT)-like permease
MIRNRRKPRHIDTFLPCFLDGEQAKALPKWGVRMPASSSVAASFAPIRFKPALLPFGALILASTIWGTSDVASKQALSGFQPMTLSALRFIVAAIVLELLCRRSGLQPLRGRSAAALGMLGVAAATVAQNLGLGWTEASNASLIQGAAPAMVVALGILVFRERIQKRHLAGIGLSLAGVVTVALATGERPGSEVWGNLLIFISALGFASFIVIGQHACTSAGPIATMTGSIRYALMILIPAAIIETSVSGRDTIQNVQPQSALLVLYLGIGCSALAYVLWGYALQYLESSRAAVFDNLVPVIGLASASLFLGEALTVRHLVGIMLVLLGVGIVAVTSSEPAPSLVLAPSQALTPA